ncbi:dienelactone hydrolase family protein [Microbacter sp. GSS18]|nr:dienelactone hydrolase family protein [Microbacter sp. GSS18]
MMISRAAVSSGTAEAGAPAVALLLHGYGSHERDLVGLGPHFGLPFASLRAPLEMPGGGAAWFAITTPGNPDPELVAAATEAIWRWVEDNLPADAPLVPIGFSQGGLMATQLLRTRPERIAATVVLAGFVQAAPQPADEDLRRTRPAVFWGRGDADGVIHPAAVSRTESWLAEHATADVRLYPGLAHGISAAELADASAHVQDRVAALAGSSSS